MARKPKAPPAAVDEELDDPTDLDIEPAETEPDVEDEEDDEDDEEALRKLQEVFRAEFDDAQDYVDSSLGPDRELAYRFFLGQPFGDEESGRSSAVLPEVRNKVHAMLPSIIRALEGEGVVEFQPTREDNVEQAKQATDYVRYWLDADGNNHYVTTYSAVWDALVKKAGVIGWRWEKCRTVSEHEYEGLTLSQAMRLQRDPEIEFLSYEVSDQVDPALQQALQQPDLTAQQQAELLALTEATLNLRVRRTRTKGRLVVEAWPPEEFLISRWAKSVDDATFVGRRRYVKASKVVEMGVDPELVADNAGRDTIFGVNNEALLREPSPNINSASNPDASQEDVLLVEGWLRYDSDGDGIAELHYVQAIGTNPVVVRDEIVPTVDVAVVPCMIEPHTVFGLSVADDMADLQDIKSHVWRNVLDSAASSVFPSLVIVEGAVEIEDALNTEMGRIIRAKAPGMVQSLAEPFNGQGLLGVLDYIDGDAAGRTGISKASQGLDPDVLQSTTKSAVTNTFAAAQERLELVIRNMVAVGFKRLYKGVLQTLIRHQDKPRMVKLRGKWAEIDPREWDADMEVIVDPIASRSGDEAKMGALTAIAGKQEQVIMTLGPNNPLCGFEELRNTYAEMTKMAGFRDVNRFWKPIDPQALAQQAGQAGQQQDPAQVLAQVEVEKAKTVQQTALAKQALDERKAAAELDLKRDQLDADVQLRAAEIQGKYGTAVDTAMIQAMIDRDRNAAQVASQERVALHRNEIQGQVAQQRAMQPQGGPDGTA